MDSERVTARVRSVQSFGVFMEFGGQHVLVHLPEVSWVFPYSPRHHFRAGEMREVLILGPSQRGQLMGSFKRLAPTADLSSRVTVGQVIEGRISKVEGQIVVVELGDGLELDFDPNDEAALVTKAVGDSLELVVARVTPSHVFFRIRS